MVDRTRKLVPRQVSSLDFGYDTLEAALATIQRAIESYGKDATIKSYQVPYDNSGKEYLGIFVMESETDEEMSARIKDEERREEWMAKREKEEFERLRKKFG